MKLFTRFITLLIVLTGTLTSSHGQSILNPNDSVINYDTLNPLAQPAFGQIGKWARTPKRVTFNTSAYKAYIYKGVPFRLRFPKTYNPAANDGKEIPNAYFFHGLGEAAPITDNEDHLYWGADYFSWSVENGTYDGYLLFMQSQGFWGNGHYDYLKEIIDYMVVNNKLDQFQVTDNGLSSGGAATWEMFLKHPTYITAAMPMDAVSIWYKEPPTLEKIKWTPFWTTHGGLDGSPAPSTVEQVRDAMFSAGGNFRNTLYPDVPHLTWNHAWNEPDFWPFHKRAYASNPWPLYNKREFCSTGPINTTIGIVEGFNSYEWRRNGVIIPGANLNILNVTQTGTYDARVLKGSEWSEWSRLPVAITSIACSTIPDAGTYRIQAENIVSAGNIILETTKDVGGGVNITGLDANDWMNYTVNIPSAGTYTVNFRVANLNTNAQFQLRRADSSVLTTQNVPVTGNSQTFKTITAQVTLPAGQQTLQIYTKASGWNINWWEIVGVAGVQSNQLPTVNAGTDINITLPANTLSLSGTASDADGSIASYTWTKISGPASYSFATPNAASTSVNGLVQGIYVFKLTVTDNNGGSSGDDITVSVLAPVPVASSADSVRIEAENWTAMFGAVKENTSDAGGGLNVGYLTDNDWMDYSVAISSSGLYKLNFRIASAVTGSQFQVRNPLGTVLTTVTVPNTGWWQDWQTISVQVTLNAGLQTLRLYSSDVKVGWNINWFEIVKVETGTINYSPVITVGPTQTITPPVNTVNLSGSATDADGIASYLWTKHYGPPGSTFSTPNAASTSVSGLIPGMYYFRLTVTDSAGFWAYKDVNIFVHPVPPVITTQRIQAENWTAMTGVQTENTTDEGGGLNVGWQETGDWMDYAVNLASAGTYKLNFRVASINTGEKFHVKNSSGSILAIITVPNTGWWQNWQTVTTTVNLPAGQQTLRILTADGKGAGWNLNWLEIISVPEMMPPVVSVGPNQTITLPTNSVLLTGSATDADGIRSYRWSIIMGRDGYVIQTPDSASTLVSGLIEGVYQFRLMATDNNGVFAVNGVTITVNANHLPVVNAGSDQTITLPVSTINLNGTATDADGIANYTWTKISGPAGSAFANANIASTSVSGLVPGTYLFRLTATDNSTFSGFDELTIIVYPAGTTTTQRIQAEDWIAMSGAIKENTADVGGGLNVGYLTDNDWMDYSVNIASAGTYTLNFRIASAVTGSQFQVRNSGGAVLATLLVPNTGWWQDWQTISAQVTLPAGMQTLRLYSNDVKVGWNINWFEISNAPAARSTYTTTVVEEADVIRSNVELYPNPVRNGFELLVNNNLTGKLTVEVFAPSGSLVKIYNLAKPSKDKFRVYLPVGELPRGNYLLKIRINEWKEVKQLIKL